MAIIIGSARHDERGKYSGGKAGDSLQKSNTNDTIGEVSMQNMYVHSKGWYILRPKSAAHAESMANSMKTACNNSNIGYDQNERLGIIKYGTATKVKTECDCGSLVRQCIKEATGKDPGNFTTANEASCLEASGLFEKRVAYISQAKTPVYNGDVLVTKQKGHTVIVVSGSPRLPKAPDGSKREAVEKPQNFHRDFSKTYTVTASSLNVRSGAGTRKSVLVAIPKGTVVRCYGYYTVSDQTRWLYVQFTYGGVLYTGFCSASYLK